MTDNAQPTTITASEWHTVAEAVKRGECVVRWGKSPRLPLVVNVVRHNPVMSDWMWDYMVVYKNGVTFGLDEDDAIFEVTWLQPPTAPAPDEIDPDFVPNKKFSDMTPEELAKWHADEYKMWTGHTVEEDMPDMPILPQPLVNMSTEERQKFVDAYNGKQPTYAAEIASQLTAAEIAALKTVNAILPDWAQQSIASEETWHVLNKLGLIWWDSFKHLIRVTKAGREVLRHLDTVDATVGATDVDDLADMPTVTISKYTYLDLCKIRNEMEEWRKEGLSPEDSQRLPRYQEWLAYRKGVWEQHMAALSYPDWIKEAQLATAPTAAAAGDDVIPETLDVDGFQHAIINMDSDLMMGRTIAEYRVRDAEKAHDEIVADLRERLREAEEREKGLRTALDRSIDHQEALLLGEQGYEYYRRYFPGSKFWDELSEAEHKAWSAVGLLTTIKALQTAMLTAKAQANAHEEDLTNNLKGDK